MRHALATTIVLVSILAAAIIPEMRGTYEDASLRSAGRELVGVCSIAASRAISLNETHRVVFDRTTGRYRIERKTGEGEPGGFVPARDIPGSASEIDPRISIEIRTSGGERADARETGAPSGWERDLLVSTPDRAISFYADGTADAVEILLQDRAGFRRILRINPTTARVQITEFESQGGAVATSAEPGGLE